MANSRVVSAVQTIPGAKTRSFKAGGSVNPPAPVDGSPHADSVPPPSDSVPPPSDSVSPSGRAPKRGDSTPVPPAEVNLSSPAIPPAPSMPRLASMPPQRTAEEAALLPTDPDAICAELLDELEAPLLQTVREAVQRLGSPERIRLWVDGQARRRLIGLTERFTTELRTAPSRQQRTSRPPPPSTSSEMTGERSSQPPPPPSRQR